MWRKQSIYRQILFSLFIWAAFVFIIAWIRQRNEKNGVAIQLPQKKKTSSTEKKAIKVLVPATSEAIVKKTDRTARKPTRSKAADDLTTITGIGPKTAAALNDAGILTYNDLANLSEEKLKKLLQDRELRASGAKAWIEQAKVASKS